MKQPSFIPGLELCGMFYEEAVKPILEGSFPDVRHAAALVGSGSEVLGFDTPMSTDHHWGPRVMLFLLEADLVEYGGIIQETLADRLPYTFRGYSTHFTPPDPQDNGTQLMRIIDRGPVNHRIELFSVRAFCRDFLGIESETDLHPTDWLIIPGQKLRSMTAGAVYRDDTGELSLLRERLAEYPHDVWLYLLAAGWNRIGQEEHFMGRTGYVGDELGSRIIAARLVHDLMALCFLMERQYPPYSKWFGTAFMMLDCAERLIHLFQAVFEAETWQDREKPLTQAFTIAAGMHNDLHITDPLPERASGFHSRPLMVIHGDVFAEAIKVEIRDPEVRRIAGLTCIGAVDQFSTNTDVLSDVKICRKMETLYT